MGDGRKFSQSGHPNVDIVLKCDANDDIIYN
jgi:hypothetical protein